MVENMHDVPYVKSNELGPETVSFMTRICAEVRKILPNTVPCGVQVNNISSLFKNKLFI